jgi:hypothetical protein
MHQIAESIRNRNVVAVIASHESDIYAPLRCPVRDQSSNTGQT